MKLRYDQRSLDARAFTLIELIVAISLSTIILGAIFFSLTAALESWRYTRNELALQQVVGTALEELLEGTEAFPGLRSALEVIEADEHRFSFVQPWVEEHIASGGAKSYQLTRHIRPGAGTPTAEFALVGTDYFRTIAVAWQDPDNLATRPRLKPLDFEAGSVLRLSYHPDPERAPDAVMTVGWDPKSKTILVDHLGGRAEIGKNFFGVQITNCRFRFYDQTNTLIENNSVYGKNPLQMITGIEVEITGKVEEHDLTLIGMIMLRNSSRQSGLVILGEGVKVPIPSSSRIRTLLLTNLMGVTAGDEIHLEFSPKSQRSYRIKLRFEQYGKTRPVIGEVVVEYPPGQVVLSERPRTSADLGVDFLAIGSGGFYDYNDDPYVEDIVLLEDEPITLTVTRMDPGGGACFIRP